jgi:hypothetical protein
MAPRGRGHHRCLGRAADCPSPCVSVPRCRQRQRIVIGVSGELPGDEQSAVRLHHMAIGSDRLRRVRNQVVDRCAVQQLLLPIVDLVRMNPELTRQLGDRPVALIAASATFALNAELCFFLSASSPATAPQELSRGQGSTLAYRLSFGIQLRGHRAHTTRIGASETPFCGAHNRDGSRQTGQRLGSDIADSSSTTF